MTIYHAVCMTVLNEICLAKKINRFYLIESKNSISIKSVVFYSKNLRHLNAKNRKGILYFDRQFEKCQIVF